MPDFISKLWRKNPDVFLRGAFGENCAVTKDEANRIFTEFDIARLKQERLDGDCDAIIPAATKTTNLSNPSSSIFHDVVLPQAIDVDVAHRSLRKGGVVDKDPQYMACLWGKSAEYDAKTRSKYVAPQSFLDLYDDFLEYVKDVHDIYSKAVPLIELQADPEKDAKIGGKLSERLAEFYARSKTLSSVGEMKKLIEDCGDSIPQSIWGHVSAIHSSVKFHFHKARKEFSEIDVEDMRRAYKDQVALNAAIEESGLVQEVQDKHAEILSKHEDVLTYNEVGHDPRRCNRAIAAQTILMNKELKRNRYFPNLSWGNFKRSYLPYSNGNKLGSALRNCRQARTFLEKICRIESMDKNGNIMTVTRFVSLPDAPAELKRLKATYPLMDLYKAEGIFYNIHKGKPYANKVESRSRTESQMAFLCNLFIDIDLKESAFLRKTSTEEDWQNAEEIVRYLIGHRCIENAIPFPSTITRSGGGFHARWNFSRPIERKNGNWENVVFENSKGKTATMSSGRAFDGMQRRLLDIFRNLGADDKAIDKARLLRPTGFDNVKRGQVTSRVFPADGETVNLYRFEDLMKCLSRPKVVEDNDFFNTVMANFLNRSVVLQTAEIIEKAKKNLENAKTTKEKRREKKSISEAKAKAIDDVKATKFKQPEGFDLGGLSGADLKKAEAVYIEYRKSSVLPAYRNESCKGFVDNANYKQRLKDFLACGRYMADQDDCENDGEKHLLGEGHRNYFALWAFQLYGNAHRDDARHYGSNKNRDVDAFMQEAYDNVYKLLIQMGIGRAWLDANYDAALGLGSDGSSSGRGVYNNMKAQLAVFWSHGRIINANAAERTNYSHTLASAKEDEERLGKYKQSPLGGVMDEDLTLSEDIALEGRFPHLGYTASVERMMRDCGITDEIAFKAGSRTLYTAKTRDALHGAWKKFIGVTVHDFAVCKAEGKEAKLPTFLKDAETNVISAALRKTRRQAVEMVAEKLGCTPGAVNNVARKYAKTGTCPRSYKETRGVLKYLDLIKLIDRDIARVDAGMPPKEMASACKEVSDKWLKRISTGAKVIYLSNAMKLTVNNLGGKEIGKRAWDDDPVPIAA